jgi:uncharacterized protein YjbJ (UPF0337 family)
MENNIETNPMNQDILAGKWKQMRGELKTWWSKLNDDDFDRISGQKDKLIGLLQERYGYAREQAEQEVERRLQEYGDKTGGAVGPYVGQGTRVRRDCREEGERGGTRYRWEDEIAGERDP